MGEGGREEKETERRKERKTIRREERVRAGLAEKGGEKMARIRGENSRC